MQLDNMEVQAGTNNERENSSNHPKGENNEDGRSGSSSDNHNHKQPNAEVLYSAKKLQPLSALDKPKNFGNQYMNMSKRKTNNTGISVEEDDSKIRGITVRPSGKWVSRSCSSSLRCCS